MQLTRTQCYVTFECQWTTAFPHAAVCPTCHRLRTEVSSTASSTTSRKSVSSRFNVLGFLRRGFVRKIVAFVERRRLSLTAQHESIRPHDTHENSAAVVSIRIPSVPREAPLWDTASIITPHRTHAGKTCKHCQESNRWRRIALGLRSDRRRCRRRWSRRWNSTDVSIAARSDIVGHPYDCSLNNGRLDSTRPPQSTVF